MRCVLKSILFVEIGHTEILVFILKQTRAAACVFISLLYAIFQPRAALNLFFKAHLDYIYLVESMYNAHNYTYVAENYICVHYIYRCIMSRKCIELSDEHLEYLDRNCIDIRKFIARCIQTQIDREDEK